MLEFEAWGKGRSAAEWDAANDCVCAVAAGMWEAHTAELGQGAAGDAVDGSWIVACGGIGG